jgi:pimeloyl-ACP methyl ester carboxylesterase
MLNFLQHPLTPFAIALVITGAGLIVGRRGRVMGGRAGLIVTTGGVILACVGVILGLGASVTAFELAKAAHDFPPPGRMVRVGRDRIHVWCEGPRSAPTVLLMGGGYSQGLAMRFYQLRLEDRWRACTVDRSGLGWSSIGHLPKTVIGDLTLVHAALAAAGERPAQAVMGHSAGGMFAANYASVYPAEVRAIVLLDPSQPLQLSIDWNARFPPLERFYNRWMPVFATMFGLAYVHSLDPLYGPGAAPVKVGAADHWDALVAWELRPSSILSTIDNGRASHDPLSYVRTPGALEGVAILLMPTQLPKLSPPDGATGWRFDNYARLMAAGRTEYLNMSSKSTLIEVPKGFEHYYPFTHPEFTVPRVRAFLERELPTPGTH